MVLADDGLLPHDVAQPWIVRVDVGATKRYRKIMGDRVLTSPIASMCSVARTAV